MKMAPDPKDEEMEKLQQETNEALEAAKKAIQQADENVAKRQVEAMQGESKPHHHQRDFGSKGSQTTGSSHERIAVE